MPSSVELFFIAAWRSIQHIFSHAEMLGWSSIDYEQSIKCLAQGHNTVPPVSLKPVTPRSHV